MDLNQPVLVLNQNYEPLNVCTTKRAIVLVVVGKAQVLENSRGVIRSPSMVFPRPSVIRLRYIIRRPRPRVKLTRREIFRRDNFTCQYCGKETHQLTVDHVIPRRWGGRHVWANVVSACPSCNMRKGGKTPQEAGMNLLQVPYEPRSPGYQIFKPFLQENKEWRKFVEGWF
ncbi:MAG: HNH endonuclease [Anaerolineae bacterium]